MASRALTKRRLIVLTVVLVVGALVIVYAVTREPRKRAHIRMIVEEPREDASQHVLALVEASDLHESTKRRLRMYHYRSYGLVSVWDPDANRFYIVVVEGFLQEEDAEAFGVPPEETALVILFDHNGNMLGQCFGYLRTISPKDINQDGFWDFILVQRPTIPDPTLPYRVIEVFTVWTTKPPVHAIFQGKGVSGRSELEHAGLRFCPADSTRKEVALEVARELVAGGEVLARYRWDEKRGAFVGPATAGDEWEVTHFGPASLVPATRSSARPK